ncbi:unnamed protein product, partial [Staurois parvus]
GSVANGQTGYQERAEEWSGIAEVRTGGSSFRIKAGSGRKQTGCRYRGSWETYTKALITGLVLLKYTSCNQPQVMA